MKKLKFRICGIKNSEFTMIRVLKIEALLLNSDILHNIKISNIRLLYLIIILII